MSSDNFDRIVLENYENEFSFKKNKKYKSNSIKYNI